ncbi:MAG: DUF2779 domain-containing protein [Nitrospirae bacterium]|nr:MAG: DUF2779 domain-containing protein [Nitrospirota bacterium]
MEEGNPLSSLSKETCERTQRGRSSLIALESRLSKSRYLAGLQCPKRLYFEVYAPYQAAPPDDKQHAMLEMGRMVGEAAQRRFPGGQVVEADHRHLNAALERTRALLLDPQVPAIFEATFQFEGILVRADILERVGDHWRLIEVKAASRIKPVHLDDLAIQAYVVEGAGLNLCEICLMYVNRHYWYPGGELDWHQLFCLQDVTEAVRDRLSKIPQQLRRLRAVLQEERPPQIEPDAHCHTPYSCPFWGQCTQEKPHRWIYHLPGGRGPLKHPSAQGIQTIDALPPEVPLTALQRRVKHNMEWISPKLSSILQAVQYPVHHLDFECLIPAVPLYPNTRPYQPLPVQWSNHIETIPGQVHHEWHLCRDHKDPREEIAVSVLQSVGKEGSICVYSDNERFLLRTLAEAIPCLRRELQQVIERLWDLCAIIQAHYYHPAFQGSFSLKSVLPALVPALAYDDLDIHDGASASAVYYRLVFCETDWVERERLALALQQYCARDTRGLVELRWALQKRVMAKHADASPG